MSPISETGLPAPFIDAIRYGPPEAVEQYLDAGISPDADLGAGLRPLELAMTSDQDEVALLLLRRGADPALAGGDSLLIKAAYSETLIRALLDAGLDPAVVDEAGNGLIHHCTAVRSPDLIRLLAERGADPSATAGTEQMSAAAMAATYWHYPVFAALADAGADLRRTDASGLTVLHYLCSENAPGGRYEDFELILDRILAAGVPIDAGTTSGLTPLMFAAEYGNTRMIESLLRRGADIHRKADSGRTALHDACAGCVPQAVEALLACGARIDDADGRGRSPLHMVGEDAHFLSLPDTDIRTICAALLSRGADINAPDALGRTPLFDSVSRKGAGLMRVLLSLGADPEHRDGSGMTVEALVRERMREEPKPQLADMEAVLGAIRARTALGLLAGDAPAPGMR